MEIRDCFLWFIRISQFVSSPTCIIDSIRPDSVVHLVLCCMVHGRTPTTDFEVGSRSYRLIPTVLESSNGLLRNTLPVLRNWSGINFTVQPGKETLRNERYWRQEVSVPTIALLVLASTVSLMKDFFQSFLTKDKRFKISLYHFSW